MFLHRFVRAYPPAAPTHADPYVLPFVGGDPLVRVNNGAFGLLRRSELPSTLSLVGDPLFLGTLDGIDCVAETVVAPSDNDAVSAWGDSIERASLRTIFADAPEDVVSLYGYASPLLRFFAAYKLCPTCGASLAPDDGFSRKCASCGFLIYPPISPAVLILVHDGDGNLLLAQKPGWGKRYSILAGFVEPGESLEDCCLRETLEEVGVTVVDPIYDGSQMWPFPQQLMVGFQVRAVTREITPDMTELADARWFSPENLPELPPPFALSRQLIDRFLDGAR